MKRRQTGMLLVGRASASWQPQLVLCVHHKWHTDTVYEIDLVKAQDMDQTLSYAVVHFGDIPEECIAGVVGHDQSILHERPSQVATYAPVIHADFRATVDRLRDQCQQQKRLDLTMRNCVNFILQGTHTKQI